jgi:hypothetical protein
MGWVMGLEPTTTGITITTADQRRFKFSAISGKDRDYIESLAGPMFRKC